MAQSGFKWVCFSAAFLMGLCGATAKAVCITKDGGSVDPSKQPVVPWATEFQQSSVILIGTVVAQKNIPDSKEPEFWSGTLYDLKVEALLKGDAGPSVQVFTPNDSGRLLLLNGVRYLLFLHGEGGHLITNACGNSAKLVYP